jgi:small subunit ribosomal protein S6
MMNVECDQETLDKLNYNFRFNDAVIRNLIISKSEAITSPSIMLEGNDKDKDEAKVKPKAETKVEAKADTEVKDDKKSEASDEVKE